MRLFRFFIFAEDIQQRFQAIESLWKMRHELNLSPSKLTEGVVVKGLNITSGFLNYNNENKEYGKKNEKRKHRRTVH